LDDPIAHEIVLSEESKIDLPNLVILIVEIVEIFLYNFSSDIPSLPLSA
jgi:hypothetical protein